MKEVLNSYDGWIEDYGQQGMETLSMQTKMSNKKDLDTEKAGTYTEKHSFISEEYGDYTDFAKGICPCQG